MSDKESKAIAVHEHVALLSVLSCVVSELSKAGHLDFYALQSNIDGTAAGHRKGGNHEMADAMHRLSEYLAITVQDQKS